MDWTKIPTNLLNGKFDDKEILAIVKYQLVYAIYEDDINDKILSRFLSKKQISIAKNFVADISANVQNEINAISKKRQNDKLRYAKNKEKLENSVSEIANEPTGNSLTKTKIREDKIIKEKINKKENPDLIFSSELGECFSLYQSNCKNLIPLGFERRNKETLALLDDVLDETDRDIGTFKELCNKANELVTIAEKKIDFKMMLRNYVGILNGKYKQPSILDGLDFS